MSDTLSVQVGDKGRVVIPADLRARHQWATGATLVVIDTEIGVLLASRDVVERVVRERLSGRDLVAELFADRRNEAAREL
jgi:AbrB family looped-hinge helix DNA binding protein